MKIKVIITRQENADYFNCSIDDVVSVEFQEYIAAVVASQIGNAPLEACKAQAVAARGLALSRGVFRGLSISDSSSVAQAYRAKRYNENSFSNAIQAAKETEGQVLTYKGKIAVTHYSANNGGTTTSSEDRWGGHYDYLITQHDPWDTATGKAKYGHGVGMSQLGAQYAANHGYTYQQILSFYYPGCILQNNYGGLKYWEMMKVSKKVIMNDKTKTIVKLAKQNIGAPYTYSALGQKVNGVRTFDCRGFTYWLLSQVGIFISTVGATTQYNTKKDWEEQGRISVMPNVVCPVFKYRESDGKMGHTGMHIGDGTILHCTQNGGVKYASLDDTSWTHYAIPKNLYTYEQLQKAGQVILMTTIKIGSSGNLVVKLQEWLNKLGYNVGTADGKFGSVTKTKVMAFQADNGLTVDGIVGSSTWSVLEDKINGEREQKKQEEPKEEPKNENMISIPIQHARAIYEVLHHYFSNT